jgi:outer membrane protein OmpA-like peptidoglycan-associated protein
MRSIVMRNKNVGVVVAAVVMSAGCASVPDRIDELDRARVLVERVDRDPMAERVASAELKQAKAALHRAEAAKDDNADLVAIKHEAYLAGRHAEIAMERIAEVKAREEIEQSEALQNKVLLEARAAEAERARALAALRGRDAEISAMEAERQRTRADRAVEHAQELEASLDQLKAEQTERGLVLTLSDVLFDTNEAQLKPGATAAIDQLAQFLVEYPKRRLLIEGHTDSRGSKAYNQSLSAKRADALREALIRQNIAPGRLRAAGMGEAYPVATNDTSAGRQQNRRVEIIISDQEGDFAAAAERAAATY